MGWVNLLWYSIIIFVISIILLIMLKTRYKKFTTAEYVLFYRTGKLLHKGYGGAYFLLPFIDELVVLPSTEQILDLKFNQVNLKANQFVTVHCTMKWRITDPVKVVGSLFQPKSLEIENINRSVGSMVDNEIRKKYNSINLKQALDDKVMFSQTLIAQLRDYFEPNGVLIIAFQIQEVLLEKRLEKKWKLNFS